MEKLLKLIGLKKVKNFTIDLFRSAIAFSKLSLKAQEANPMSFNYCFLGNPVTFLYFFLKDVRQVCYVRPSKPTLGQYITKSF
jgi:hypothetical protein